MRSLYTVASVVLGRLMSWKRLVWLAILSLLPAVITLVSVPDDPTAIDTILGPAGVGLVIPVAALVFAAAGLGDDRRRGTIVFIAAKPVPRTLLAFGAANAVIAATAIVAVIMVALVGLAGLSQGAGFTSWFGALLAALLAALGYGGVFSMLAYTTGRSTLIGLAYVFLWEGVLSVAVTTLTGTSIARISMGAYAAIVDLSSEALEWLGQVQPSVLRAAVTTGAIAIIATLFNTYLLRQRDIL